MEFVFLILVVVIGAAVLLRKVSDGRQPNAPLDSKSNSTETHGRAQAFDPGNAQRITEKTVVEGRASIVDGDTIKIQKTQIRLYGVDAPEIDHPFGQKAKWALVKLCKDQTVRAEIQDIDHYGRTVAKCLLPDGRDLSAEMVKIGMAIDWPKFSGGRYSAFELPGVRKKLWLADARQKGRMHVWEKFEANKKQSKQ